MGAGLKWVQPSARRYEYVLVSGDKAVGALAWKSWRDSLAFAEAPEGRWTFKQVGFWQSKSTIRVAGDDADAGLFESGWSGAGTLRLGGKSFKWRPANSWYTKWEFADADGAVIRFKSTHRLLKNEAEVEVTRQVPEATLLVLFGWYVLLNTIESWSAMAGTAG
jgi:hypothetical protein